MQGKVKLSWSQTPPWPREAEKALGLSLFAALYMTVAASQGSRKFGSWVAQLLRPPVSSLPPLLTLLLAGFHMQSSHSLRKATSDGSYQHKGSHVTTRGFWPFQSHCSQCIFDLGSPCNMAIPLESFSHYLADG